MSEYLELPGLKGSIVSKGDPLPEGHKRPDRTTKPLSPEKKIPEKSNMEKADEDVIAATEEKERKKSEKGPTVKRKVVLEQDVGKKKRKKHKIEEVIVSSDDKTVDVSPLNQAEPEVGKNVEKRMRWR